MSRKFKVIAISYSPDDAKIIQRAKAKARRLRKSFSAYVCELIEKDIDEPIPERQSTTPVQSKSETDQYQIKPELRREN